MTINKIWREPLIHFFFLGAILFVAYGWLNRNSGVATDEIVIDRARMDGIAMTFEKTWQRPPTEKEVQGLIESWVREEILYREGILIGFDRDDPVIRRRVAQKMSFVADGLTPDVPDENELQAWLDSHVDDYRIPPSYAFRQVYFDPQRHGDQLEAVLTNARAQLDKPASSELPGDTTMLPTDIRMASAPAISRIFGSDFANSLADLATGSWQGPIESEYGLHFVEIQERIDGRDPTLSEVRAAVERDLLREKSQEIGEQFYAALRQRYVVRIDAPTPAAPQ